MAPRLRLLLPGILIVFASAWAIVNVNSHVGQNSNHYSVKRVDGCTSPDCFQATAKENCPENPCFTIAAVAKCDGPNCLTIDKTEADAGTRAIGATPAKPNKLRFIGLKSCTSPDCFKFKATSTCPTPDCAPNCIGGSCFEFVRVKKCGSPNCFARTLKRSR